MKLNTGGFHFLNYLSFYFCPHLACRNLSREHWTGFYRKKVFQLGKLTIWKRTCSTYIKE